MLVTDPIVAAYDKLNTFTDIVWQRADSTGDVLHVVAALSVRKSLGLIVFDFDRSNDNGPKMVQKYKTEYGIAANRIVYADCRAMKVEDVLRKAKTTGDLLKKKYVFLVNTTNIVAKEKKLPKELKELLRGPKAATIDDLVEATDEELLDFWIEKKVKFDQPAVILWGRTSGKDRGVDGPHPYGDSSTTGISQIAAKCVQKGWSVVLAGDIVEAKFRAGRFPGCVYLGKFWGDTFWKGESANKIKTQPRQLRLFYVLKKVLKYASCRLVHVGMRSGGLDAYAFSGQSIIYLVPAGVDDQRIQFLAKKFTKNWIPSNPAQPPKRAFTRNWDPDWLNAVAHDRDWLNLLSGSPQFLTEKARLKEFYPTDIDTQIHAKLAYQTVKKMLAEVKPADMPALLESLCIQEQEQRGFSADYLEKLLAQIDGALSRAF